MKKLILFTGTLGDDLRAEFPPAAGALGRALGASGRGP